MNATPARSSPGSISSSWCISGVVVRQRMAGLSELVGSDVIVVHRLLKNSVTEELALAAYALFTDACVRP